MTKRAKKYSITIPDVQTNPRHIHHNDSVSFKFGTNQNNFTVSGGDAFTPPLPSGGFLASNKIGPYRANTPDVTVTFSYQDENDDDPGAASHTILIGN